MLHEDLTPQALVCKAYNPCALVLCKYFTSSCTCASQHCTPHALLLSKHSPCIALVSYKCFAPHALSGINTVLPMHWCCANTVLPPRTGVAQTLLMRCERLYLRNGKSGSTLERTQHLEGVHPQLLSRGSGQEARAGWSLPF